MSELMTTTYSMWRLFRNCRKACEYRYLRDLVPLERDHNLAFGSVIHDCLEIWHGQRDLEKVLEHIDQVYANRSHDDHQHADWHLATAMMSSYTEHYPVEDFDVVALEKTFEGAIINPDTNAASRSFVLAGKVDGLVKQDGQYFLLEHKTASQIDAGYLERLWTDFQIIIYAWYLEQTLGIHISGIIYNVLVKAKLRQSKGETEAEFETRRAELIAKSKTGKSSAKRKMPETDESFQQRLKEKYLEPGMFHRELLYISRDQFDELRSELWELSKAMLDARRRNTFYRNTAFCFQYGRACPYFPLCRSGENPNVIENHYQRVLPHEELRDGASEDAAPVF
ncbi:MAG: PD-(D/E)XK nuclease family protein [Phycisphaerae bacterium]